jgi:hypothetical protein
MIRISKISGLILLLISINWKISSAQQTYIRGVVSDSAAYPIEAVSISLLNTPSGIYTDKRGSYSLNIPTDGNEYIVVFSHIGFRPERRKIKCDKPEIVINMTMYEDVTSIGEVIVNSGRENIAAPLMRIPVKDIHLLPSASGSFEAILKTMPGVSSNNELTSQYSVRGGNFDENLVYVNDIEIFRPFLIRSGQQEGLSFINPDLISSVKFSSGGFSAMYGDRMSSVLDISYRKPVSEKGSVNPGLLTSSVHYEGITRDQKLSYLIGVRYKSSRLMLKTLDAGGITNRYLQIFSRLSVTRRVRDPVFLSFQLFLQTLITSFRRAGLAVLEMRQRLSGFTCYSGVGKKTDILPGILF